MKKIVRKILRWLVREDFERLNAVLKHYKVTYEEQRLLAQSLEKDNVKLKAEIDSYKTFNVIPKSLFSAILSILPDPKTFKCYGASIKIIKNNVKVVPNSKEGKPYEVTIHMTAVTEDLLYIHVQELGIQFNVECVLNKGQYNMLGVMTDIQAWFWNFSKSGLTLVSDADFFMITEFMNAQRNVFGYLE